MRRFIPPLLLILTLILAACSTVSSSDQTPPQADPVSTQSPDAVAGESDSSSNDSAVRIDEQGAIIFEITPLNLASPTNTFDFDVALTTHSIDLSMDLATVSTLTTDTGVSVESTLWDAPRGGHHVEGKLIFPATKDGKPILKGATKLTLTILNVDASSRIFEWDLK
ncbi:MAG: hypothetical protein HYU84_08135 [Chloroflexi bacterium]|nr:hypothetical protein [Chloroflexota bacterium]MBI3167513.1 hypothetical protein [Chloroflexota bacterium]